MTSKRILVFLPLIVKPKDICLGYFSIFCLDEDWVMEFGENYLGLLGIIFSFFDRWVQ